MASIYVIYQCWKERRDTFDGIYGTTTPAPHAASVISGVPPARSASRVSNRPLPHVENTDTNGMYPREFYFLQLRQKKTVRLRSNFLSKQKFEVLHLL